MVGVGRRDILSLVWVLVFEDSVCSFQELVDVRPRSLLLGGYTVKRPRIVNCGAAEVCFEYVWHLYGAQSCYKHK